MVRTVAAIAPAVGAGLNRGLWLAYDVKRCRINGSTSGDGSVPFGEPESCQAFVATTRDGDAILISWADRKSSELTIFQGCIPALMTPCDGTGNPNWDALVRKGLQLMDFGMNAVVYCGSMGDWPLLSDAERQEGVRQLVNAGVPVVVGTGAQNSSLAADHASHAQQVGAAGLMVIPRVLSRTTSVAAQRAHFAGVLAAAPDIPAVIYNSPYYGYQTRAELFFDLRREFSNLVGFKEFGGADSLTYAAENITSGDPTLSLMVGVDTQVLHGFVRCGAVGAITGVGNALPQPTLRLLELCRDAAKGDTRARRLAAELEDAMSVLSKFDEGPDLVLYYKYLMVLEGDQAYRYHFNEADQLTPSQEAFVRDQWTLFKAWWNDWEGAVA